LQNLDDEYSIPDPAPDAAPVGDFDSLIRGKERELRPYISRMEELRLQFIDELVAFAAQMFDTLARRYVVRYPEVTLGMGKENLASMKALVVGLQRKAPKIVTNVLSDPGIWWHLAPSLHDTSQYEILGNSFVGNRFPEKIDKAVRRVLGELGKVLEQFGFSVVTRVPQEKGGEEFWFLVPENGLSAPEPYYPHMLVWSEEMQNTIQKYNSQYKNALVIYVEIVKLRDEQKRQQASKLWDST